MQTAIVYAQGDGEAANRLKSLMETLGVKVDQIGADAPVIALLTPTALKDALVLRNLRERTAQGSPLLTLAVGAPAAFPTPADLARIVEWLSAPAQPAPSPKYHVVTAINSVIGEDNVTVNFFGGKGWSAQETATLASVLRAQQSDVPISADEVRALFADVQAQILQVDSTLRLGFAAMLTRFDVSEQRIVAPLMARLDAQHTAEMAALLDVFDAVAISADDLTQLLTAVSIALAEILEKSAQIADKELTTSVGQLAELVEAPALDVKHKLKVTLPIIPLLLEYEGEIELNGRLNLESAWGAFKRVLHLE